MIVMRRIIEKYLKVFGTVGIGTVGIIGTIGTVPSFRFSYWVYPILVQSVRIHFSRRSHKTSRLVSLTSVLHVLQEYFERDMVW